MSQSISEFIMRMWGKDNSILYMDHDCAVVNSNNPSTCLLFRDRTNKDRFRQIYFTSMVPDVVRCTIDTVKGQLTDGCIKFLHGLSK